MCNVILGPNNFTVAIILKDMVLINISWRLGHDCNCMCSLNGMMAIHSGPEEDLINHACVYQPNHRLYHPLLWHCGEKLYLWWMSVKVQQQLLVEANEMRESICDWYRPWRHMRTSGPFLCWAAMRLWHHEGCWKWNGAPSCRGGRRLFRVEGCGDWAVEQQVNSFPSR